MSIQDAARLEQLADRAYRLLVVNVAQAKQLAVLCRQAQRPGSTTTELGINVRTEETITNILSTVHSFRSLARECITIYNRKRAADRQVTCDEPPDAA